MKRILPILLVILLIGNMCFTATAVGGSQQTESRTSFVGVYCQAPESWEECYVYWWGSTEGSAQWPGYAMTKGSDGLWIYDILDDLAGGEQGATGLIFHDNRGNQTDDLLLPADNKVKYVVADKEWVTHDETLLPSDVPTVSVYCTAPEYWEFCRVYWWGSETECVWPGELMSVVESRVYSLDIPSDATNVIFSSYDDYRDGILQTPNLTIPTDGRLLYAIEKEEWLDPVPVVLSSFYVMGDSALCGSDWVENDPNNLMIPNGFGTWYQFYDDVEPGFYQLRITDGTLDRTWGDSQSGTDNGTYWVDVEETNTVCVYFDAINETLQVEVGLTGNPNDAPVVPTTYRVVGDKPFMGSWDPASNVGLMEEIDDRKYAKTFEAVEPGTYQFAITENGSWDHSWGMEGGNCTLKVTETSDVTIYFNARDYCGIISVDIQSSVQWTKVYCHAPDDWTQCYAEWWGSKAEISTSPRVPMTMDENSIWYCTVPADAAVLIFSSDSDHQTAELQLPTNQSNMYSIAWQQWMPYTYDFVVQPEPQTQYYVAGVADLCGSSWVEDDPNNAMTQIANGVWTKVYEEVPSGSYALTVTDGTWDNYWGEVEYGDVYFDIDELCERLTVNFALINGVGIVTVTFRFADDPPDNPTSGPDENDFYLVGNINGAEYGIGEDCENLGEYKFVDGKLTVRFDTDSYVLVKSDDNTFLYAKTYCEETGVELSYEYDEKMKVPGGVEVTFTFARTGDATWWLSYVVNDSDTGDGENNGNNDNNGNGGNTDNGGNNSNGLPEDGNDAVLTLWAKVPASWTTVRAYTWAADNSPQSDDWPGTVMTRDGQWYRITITDKVVNVVINNGADQTQNLKVDSGKDLYVVVGDDGKGTVYYADGTTAGGDNGNMGSGGADDENITGIPSNFRVVGNADWMGNWDPANEQGRMYEVSPGVYKLNVKDVRPGTYELKITQNGTWDRSWGDNGNNYCFQITETCMITITFVLEGENGIITVKGIGASHPCTGGDDDDDIDIFRIQGSADWMGKSDLSKTIRMDQIATGVYQARLKGVTPGVYFFRVFRGSNPDHFWGDNGKDASFTVLAISDVLITFDLKTGKITTELIAVPQTDNENSESVPDATVAPTEDVTDSTVGHPTTEPIPPTPDDGEVLRPEDTKPAQPNAGVEGGVCSAQPSPAIHLANMFWFCCVAVGIYGVFLLIRRRREMQVQTVEGHQFGAAPPLSIKDTEKLVADNPPEMPSAALDQRIFESIQKLNKES